MRVCQLPASVVVVLPMCVIPKCLIIKLGVLWYSKCQPPVAVMLAMISFVTLNCHCWPEVCLH